MARSTRMPGFMTIVAIDDSASANAASNGVRRMMANTITTVSSASIAPMRDRSSARSRMARAMKTKNSSAAVCTARLRNRRSTPR